MKSLFQRLNLNEVNFKNKLESMYLGDLANHLNHHLDIIEIYCKKYEIKSRSIDDYQKLRLKYYSFSDIQY